MMVLARLVVAALLLWTASACQSVRETPTTPSTLVDPASATIPAAPAAPVPPATARYEVTFESTWAKSTHPTDFPDDAHFSGLIGGTHSSAVSFWREGELATEGIRAMAERGAKSGLSDEVTRAVTDGRAQQVLSGGAIARSPGAVSLEFELSQAFPLVTVVSMVAPSPDWFAGVSALALFANGQWLSEVVVDMTVYDAGTDSGVTFRSPDEETRPRQPIHRLTGYPIGDGAHAAPFGRIVFRRK